MRLIGEHIICEITGYGATSDGADMVAPSGEGAERCMKMAMQETSGPIDYINTHGTSTPVGDLAELKAIKNVFGKAVQVLVRLNHSRVIVLELQASMSYFLINYARKMDF